MALKNLRKKNSSEDALRKKFCLSPARRGELIFFSASQREF